MNKNNFASNISEQKYIDIEKERTETMSTKAFIQWCEELNVSASYIKKDVLTDKASSMMHMMGKQRWIERYTQVNKTNN
jgi:hypothetical protein